MISSDGSPSSTSSLSPERFTNTDANTGQYGSFFRSSAISDQVIYLHDISSSCFWTTLGSGDWRLAIIGVYFIIDIGSAWTAAKICAIAASLVSPFAFLRHSSWYMVLLNHIRSCSKFCFKVAFAAAWRLSTKLIYCWPSWSTMPPVFESPLSNWSRMLGAIIREMKSAERRNFCRRLSSILPFASPSTSWSVLWFLVCLALQ